MIFVALFLTLLINFYFGRNTLQGEFFVEKDSYEFLKKINVDSLSFIEEKTDKEILFFNKGVKSSIEERTVDTAAGIFGGEFLESRTFQKQERVYLEFDSSGHGVSIKYSIEKRSAVNGSEIFDVFNIYIIHNLRVVLRFSKCIYSEKRGMMQKGEGYFNNYRKRSLTLDENEVNIFTCMQKGNILILDDEYKIMRLNLNESEIKLKITSPNFATSDNTSASSGTAW